ncbi:uncharacterized protein LOC62_01G001680 [Vanrija pseudolonga]|uniref:Zn(2)-C6 fungal-type domain-containing protein n=1 Tax=Vanrija pseudolonga TaxID=143232 RepID=A0AAF0Y1E3_9TREE|nr:hypothetical protein LOC62_01G001680 [Vanrija pseudolonga]
MSGLRPQDTCHRMKIRCIDRANPPCRRCATMDIPCTFTLESTPSSYRIKSNQDRVAHLENQMDVVQSSMKNVEAMLRTLVEAKTGSGSASAASKQSPRSGSSYRSGSAAPTATSTPIPPDLPPPGWAQLTASSASPHAGSNSTPGSAMPASAVRRGSAPQQAERAGAPEESEDEDDDEALKASPMRHIIYHEEEERRRTQEVSGTRSTLDDDDGKPPAYPLNSLLFQRDDLQPHEYPDPVQRGFCTEQEGRHLFEILRARSPFCITVIMIAGQLAMSGNGYPSSGSTLRNKLVRYAEKIAAATLFTPVATLETVQAMSRSGMGVGKSPEELEKERPLVNGARVWLATLKTHNEMCGTHGRPVQCDRDESIKLGRLFLEHPLATKDDSRCIVLNEVMSFRAPVQLARRQGVTGRTMDGMIDEVIQNLEVWESFWLEYYGKIGLSDDDFLVQELSTIKNYATLQNNNARMPGAITKRDIQRMPSDRRDGLISATRAAARLVARAARGSETAKIRYGNRNVRLGLAHAARYLIRMASLFPEAIDRRQAAKDVELLADELSRFPDFHFSHFLRRVVAKARSNRVIPAAGSSPPPQQQQVQPPDHVPQPIVPDTTPPLDFDFAIADNIFATEDWMSIIGGVGSVPQPPQAAPMPSGFPFMPMPPAAQQFQHQHQHQHQQHQVAPAPFFAGTFDTSMSQGPDGTPYWDQSKQFWPH